MDSVTLLRHVGSLGLPLPQKEKEFDRFVDYLKKARALMTFPPGFNPGAEQMNKETISFLKKWKIYDLWVRDPYAMRAVELLEEPQARRMLDVLLLGPLNISSIAKRLKDRFGFPDEVANPQVVRAYNHYFWNVHALSINEWRQLIYDWLPGRNSDLLMALYSPRDAAGVSMSIAAADNHFEALREVDMYKAMRDHGFRLFMEHALLDKGGFARTQGALLAFQVVKMAGEELDKRRGGSAELLDEMKRFETLYDTKRPTTIKELPTVRAVLPAETPKEKIS